MSTSSWKAHNYCFLTATSPTEALSTGLRTRHFISCSQNQNCELLNNVLFSEAEHLQFLKFQLLLDSESPIETYIRRRSPFVKRWILCLNTSQSLLRNGVVAQKYKTRMFDSVGPHSPWLAVHTFDVVCLP